MARTKRTYKNFKIAVANESKRYEHLKRCNGQFNEKLMKLCFDAGYSAIQTCSSF